MVRVTNQEIRTIYKEFPPSWEMYVEVKDNMHAEVALVLPDLIFFTYDVMAPAIGELKYLIIPAISTLLFKVREEKKPLPITWLKPYNQITPQDLAEINGCLQGLANYDDHNIVDQDLNCRDEGSYD